MKEQIVEAVRKILGSAGVKNVEIRSEQDLAQWLDERKRYRDRNRVELDKLEERFSALAAREEEGIREFKTTEPNSLKRKQVLQRVQDLRDQAKAEDQLMQIRRANIKVNSRLVTEIEKAMAATDVGLETDQIEDMMGRFEVEIRKWYDKVDTASSGRTPSLEPEDTSALSDLERELEGASATAPDAAAAARPRVGRTPDSRPV